MHLQARMHTGELEQPNQLYLKEVGSLNVGVPAHLSMRARVPPTQRELDQCVPHDAASGCFIALAHMLCDIMNDVTVWRHNGYMM